MLASKKKSIPDWHLFITKMETKWTLWYAMTSHVIAYRLLELLFGTHTFYFNCFFEEFNCVLTQIRCLSRVLFFIRCNISPTENGGAENAKINFLANTNNFGTKIFVTF